MNINFEKPTSPPMPKLHNGFFHVFNGDTEMGVSSYLCQLQQSVLRTINSQYLAFSDPQESDYSNLICLSGNALEEFKSQSDFNDYLDKSNRHNTFYYNMSSSKNNLTLPFQVMFQAIANVNNHDCEKRVEQLLTQLQKMDFNNIEIKFKVQDNMSTHMCNTHDDLLSLIQFMNLNKGFVIDDVVLTKQSNDVESQKYGLRELSRQEYIFVRALFVLCVAVDERSLVLYDEIENGLHPQMQSDFMQMIIDVVNVLGNGKTTVVIATYSPLVTASFSVPNVKISSYNDYDLEWKNYHYYGWNSNSILKTQFLLDFPRPNSFIEQFNQLLDYYHTNDMIGLKQEIDKLEQKSSFQLPDNDPLYNTLKLLKEELKLFQEQVVE